MQRLLVRLLRSAASSASTSGCNWKSVSAGTTVAFANHDGEAHELVADDKSFDSGAIDPHSTWRHTFSTPGRTIHCDYHPYMTSVVVVN
jgi:plastocyanin